MKMIKKSVKITTITASSIEVDNGNVIVKDLPPIVTTKKVTDKNAAKIYRNESGTTSDFKVTSYKTEVIEYSMDIETFIKYATVTEK